MIGFVVGQWLLNTIAVVQFVWLLVAHEPNQFIAVARERAIASCERCYFRARSEVLAGH
jgi:hypothetical protein